MQKIVLVTGGFDPLHSGHIAYFQSARELGDLLIVGVNTDSWLMRKKGRAFMTWRERAEIVKNLRMVHDVIEFDDWDDSACHAITTVRKQYPHACIIFANGGDRTDKNIPEMDVKDDNVKFVFGVGGFNKMNSSSWILEEWKAPRTNRDWGHYRVLYEHGNTTKVKELVVEPGKQLSMQRHEHRTELWYVAQGIASVFTLDDNGDRRFVADVSVHQNHMIFQHRWHQLENRGTDPLKIIEIQYGDQCQENDIERRSI
jgi:cytidyltransferase-like protein